MSYRDLADAAGALYGSTLYGMHTTGSSELGPVWEPDDLAQAWINGDHDRVNRAVEAHNAEIRARVVPVIVKSRVSKKARILELRRRGCTRREIAAEVKTTSLYVVRVVRAAGLGRAPYKVNRSRLASLRASGMTLRAIATAENLSVFTVCRVLRGKQ